MQRFTEKQKEAGRLLLRSLPSLAAIHKWTGLSISTLEHLRAGASGDQASWRMLAKYFERQLQAQTAREAATTVEPRPPKKRKSWWRIRNAKAKRRYRQATK